MCYFENGFIAGIVGLILTCCFMPIVVKYIMLPIYKVIGDFCLNQEIVGGFIIISCWIGFACKILVAILEFIPLFSWGSLVCLSVALSEIAQKHIFHFLISIIIGVASGIVCYALFGNNKKDDDKTPENKE